MNPSDRTNQVTLVVDTRGWAFSHVADYIKASVRGYRFRILYTEDYKSYGSFLMDVSRSDCGILFFFSRTFLFDMISYLSIYNRKCRNVLYDNCVLTTIPDHALSTQSEIRDRSTYFSVIDAYVTINESLFRLYSGIDEIRKPYGVIHDHPALLTEAPALLSQRNQNDPLKLLWVGNSQWGKGYGYVDHKGLNSIIKPTVSRLQKEGFNITLDIYDSSEKAYPKKSIEQAMINTDVLLCASTTEGTPLPVVEAMAYDCAVISTDVGVVSSVLPDIQKEFIIDRKVDDFHDAILKFYNDRTLLTEAAQKNAGIFPSICEGIALQWQQFFTDSCKDYTIETRKAEKDEALKYIADQAGIEVRLSPIAPLVRNNRLLKSFINHIRHLFIRS